MKEGHKRRPKQPLYATLFTEVIILDRLTKSDVN